MPGLGQIAPLKKDCRERKTTHLHEASHKCTHPVSRQQK